MTSSIPLIILVKDTGSQVYIPSYCCAFTVNGRVFQNKSGQIWELTGLPTGPIVFEARLF